MMKQPRAEVNELLQIQVVDDPNSRTYYSRVEDADEERLSISWPLDGGMPVPFHRHEPLSLSFTRQDAVYGFRAVIDETVTGPIPMLRLHATEGTQRIQRRDYVRVAVLLPVELSGVMSSAGGSAADQDNVLLIKTTTINISGGGFAFQHRKMIPLGTVFDVKLSLPSSPEPIPASARVVRVEAREDANKKRIFRMGVQFLAMPERVRSRIIRYVFESQKAALSL
jgi:c-di-GMP-binding flagellar brake protein YcgR